MACGCRRRCRRACLLRGRCLALRFRWGFLLYLVLLADTVAARSVDPSPACGGGLRRGMFDGRCNRFENTLPVAHDVMIVEAQNTKTFANKVSISPGIALLLF